MSRCPRGLINALSTGLPMGYHSHSLHMFALLSFAGCTHPHTTPQYSIGATNNVFSTRGNMRGHSLSVGETAANTSTPQKKK